MASNNYEWTTEYCTYATSSISTLVLAEVEVMITTIIAQSIETVALLYVVIA